MSVRREVEVWGHAGLVCAWKTESDGVRDIDAGIPHSMGALSATFDTLNTLIRFYVNKYIDHHTLEIAF